MDNKLYDVILPDEILFNNDEDAIMVYVVKRLHSKDGICEYQNKHLSQISGLPLNAFTKGLKKLENYIQITKRCNSKGHRISDKITFTEFEGHYTKVKPEIILDKNLHYKQKVFLFKIMKLTNKKQEFYRGMSLRRLAKTFGYDKMKFCRLLESLSEAGYIKVEKDEDGYININFTINEELKEENSIFYYQSKIESLLEDLKIELSNEITNEIEINLDILFDLGIDTKEYVRTFNDILKNKNQIKSENLNNVINLPQSTQNQENNTTESLNNNQNNDEFLFEWDEILGDYEHVSQNEEDKVINLLKNRKLLDKELKKQGLEWSRKKQTRNYLMY